MASHVVVLFDRAPGASYPTSLVAPEEVFYLAGMAYKYPFHVRVVRHASGAGSKVKFQGAPLPLNTCGFAVRGPSGQHGLLSIAAVSGDFYKVRLTQQTGASASINSTFTSDLLTILLPTDSLGRPSGTPAIVGAYINGSLSSNFSATYSGFTSGILGSTLIERPCPREHWEDIVSTVGGLLPAAVEQTITPSAGSSSEVVLEVNVRNYYAIRALAVSAGMPHASDHVTVLGTVEGA